jgi:hypothetical protein
VITGYGPEVDPAVACYQVPAFIALAIRQVGGHDPVADRLARSRGPRGAYTGASDKPCRVVTLSNAALQRAFDAIAAIQGVVRSATVISLATQVPCRILSSSAPPHATPPGRDL